MFSHASVNIDNYWLSQWNLTLCYDKRPQTRSYLESFSSFSLSWFLKLSQFNQTYSLTTRRSFQLASLQWQPTLALRPLLWWLHSLCNVRLKIPQLIQRPQRTWQVSINWQVFVFGFLSVRSNMLEVLRDRSNKYIVNCQVLKVILIMFFLSRAIVTLRCMHCRISKNPTCDKGLLSIFKNCLMWRPTRNILKYRNVNGQNISLDPGAPKGWSKLLIDIVFNMPEAKFYRENF